MTGNTTDIIDRLQAELDELDQHPVHLDGRQVKPSQCYRFQASPAHLLFNTNCPDDLRTRIQSIIDKYLSNEGGSQ